MALAMLSCFFYLSESWLRKSEWHCTSRTNSIMVSYHVPDYFGQVSLWCCGLSTYCRVAATLCQGYCQQKSIQPLRNCLIYAAHRHWHSFSVRLLQCGTSLCVVRTERIPWERRASSLACVRAKIGALKSELSLCFYFSLLLTLSVSLSHTRTARRPHRL